MTEASRCQAEGALVNASGLLPADPAIFYWRGAPDVVGCNRLRCSTCGVFVVQRPDLKHEQGSHEKGGEAYPVDDWTTLPYVKPHPGARLYACKCGFYLELSRATLDDRDPAHPLPPWSCGGHPPVTLPFELDGLLIGASAEDVTRVVESVLLSGTRPPRATSPEKAFYGAWLAKLAQLLGASTNGARFADAVGNGVAAAWEKTTDPLARAEIVNFFHVLPRAPGADRFLRRFLEAPAELVGVVVPGLTPPTLEDVFVWAVRERVRLCAAEGEDLGDLTGDVIAKGTAASARRVAAGDASKDAAATAERWKKLLSEAIGADDVVMAARAEEIVRASPPLALGVLQILRIAKSARLVEVAEKLVKVEGVDRAELKRFGDKVGGQLKAALA